MGIGNEGLEAAFEVVAEVSERCVSIYSSERLTDLPPTVSRLPGGQASASHIPTLSTDGTISSASKQIPLLIPIRESYNFM